MFLLDEAVAAHVLDPPEGDGPVILMARYVISAKGRRGFAVPLMSRNPSDIGPGG
jgi:hypothetical protein